MCSGRLADILPRMHRASSVLLLLAACRAAAPPPTASPTLAPNEGASETRTPPADEPTGILDKNQIRQVVRDHIGAVRACYNRGLASDPTLQGRVVLLFAIGPEGTVTAADVESSTLPPAAEPVARCIAEASRQWRFPAPTGGGTLTVSYPFVLESSDPVSSLAGLAAGPQSPERWFAVKDHPPDTLIIEVLEPGARASAPNVVVTLKIYSDRAEESREAVTDRRGLATFSGLPREGTANAQLAADTEGKPQVSESVALAGKPMATIMVRGRR